MATLCGVDIARPRKPTLDTVAGVVGVSRATVSNAYNRPDQLSAALRERILAAALDLGYAGPDPVARSLATRSRRWLTPQRLVRSPRSGRRRPRNAHSEPRAAA